MTSTRVVVSAALVFASALTAQALVSQGSSAGAVTQPRHPPRLLPASADKLRRRRQDRVAAAGAGAETRRPRSTRNAAPAATASIWAAGARPACSTTCGHADRTTSRSPATSCNGIPNTEMMPFKEQLTEPQIWQLVAYLKTQGANLKEKPTYVPDPDGQVIKTEKQTFKIEIVAREFETPWGLAFLPDGRLLITERPGPPAHRREGAAAAGAGDGHADGLGAAGRRPVRRRGPSRSTRRTAGSTCRTAEPGPNNTAPPSAAAAAAGLLPQPRRRWRSVRRQAPARARRRPAPRTGAPRLAGAAAGAPTAPAALPPPANAPANTSNTVIVRGKINANNEWVEQQVIFRAKPELYTASQRRTSARGSSSTAKGICSSRIGERGADDERAGPVQPARQDSPRQRRRLDPEGQSVRRNRPTRSRRSGATAIAIRRGSRGIRSPASCGRSEHGPQGGDEINIIEPGHNYGWGVITMGIQPGITEARRGRHGAADRLLHADDRAERHRVLQRERVSRSGRTTCSSAPRRPAAAPAGDRPATRSRTRKSSSTSSAACTT